MMALSRRRVRIVNALGFHLRAADQFTRLAQRFRAEIRVSHGNKLVDGKSILDLSTLGAGRDERLEVQASGPDAEAAVEALAGLIEAGFHETAAGEA